MAATFIEPMDSGGRALFVNSDSSGSGDESDSADLMASAAPPIALAVETDSDSDDSEPIVGISARVSSSAVASAHIALHVASDSDTDSDSDRDIMPAGSIAVPATPAPPVPTPKDVVVPTRPPAKVELVMNDSTRESEEIVINTGRTEIDENKRRAEELLAGIAARKKAAQAQEDAEREKKAKALQDQRENAAERVDLKLNEISEALIDFANRVQQWTDEGARCSQMKGLSALHVTDLIEEIHAAFAEADVSSQTSWAQETLAEHIKALELKIQDVHNKIADLRSCMSADSKTAVWYKTGLNLIVSLLRFIHVDLAIESKSDILKNRFRLIPNMKADFEEKIGQSKTSANQLRNLVSEIIVGLPYYSNNETIVENIAPAVLRKHETNANALKPKFEAYVEGEMGAFDDYFQRVAEIVKTIDKFHADLEEKKSEWTAKIAERDALTTATAFNRDVAKLENDVADYRNKLHAQRAAVYEDLAKGAGDTIDTELAKKYVDRYSLWYGEEVGQIEMTFMRDLAKAREQHDDVDQIDALLHPISNPHHPDPIGPVIVAISGLEGQIDFNAFATLVTEGKAICVRVQDAKSRIPDATTIPTDSNEHTLLLSHIDKLDGIETDCDDLTQDAEEWTLVFSEPSQEFAIAYARALQHRNDVEHTKTKLEFEQRVEQARDVYVNDAMSKSRKVWRLLWPKDLEGIVIDGKIFLDYTSDYKTYRRVNDETPYTVDRKKFTVGNDDGPLAAFIQAQKKATADPKSSAVTGDDISLDYLVHYFTKGDKADADRWYHDLLAMNGDALITMEVAQGSAKTRGLTSKQMKILNRAVSVLKMEQEARRAAASTVLRVYADAFAADLSDPEKLRAEHGTAVRSLVASLVNAARTVSSLELYWELAALQMENPELDDAGRVEQQDNNHADLDEAITLLESFVSPMHANTPTTAKSLSNLRDELVAIAAKERAGKALLKEAEEVVEAQELEAESINKHLETLVGGDGVLKAAFGDLLLARDNFVREHGEVSGALDKIEKAVTGGANDASALEAQTESVARATEKVSSEVAPLATTLRTTHEKVQTALEELSSVKDGLSAISLKHSLATQNLLDNHELNDEVNKRVRESIEALVAKINEAEVAHLDTAIRVEAEYMEKVGTLTAAVHDAPEQVEALEKRCTLLSDRIENSLDMIKRRNEKQNELSAALSAQVTTLRGKLEALDGDIASVLSTFDGLIVKESEDVAEKTAAVVKEDDVTQLEMQKKAYRVQEEEYSESVSTLRTKLAEFTKQDAVAARKIARNQAAESFESHVSVEETSVGDLSADENEPLRTLFAQTREVGGVGLKQSDATLAELARNTESTLRRHDGVLAKFENLQTLLAQKIVSMYEKEAATKISDISQELSDLRDDLKKAVADGDVIVKKAKAYLGDIDAMMENVLNNGSKDDDSQRIVDAVQDLTLEDIDGARVLPNARTAVGLDGIVTSKVFRSSLPNSPDLVPYTDTNSFVSEDDRASLSKLKSEVEALIISVETQFKDLEGVVERVVHVQTNIRAGIEKTLEKERAAAAEAALAVEKKVESLVDVAKGLRDNAKNSLESLKACESEHEQLVSTVQDRANQIRRKTGEDNETLRGGMKELQEATTAASIVGLAIKIVTTHGEFSAVAQAYDELSDRIEKFIEESGNCNQQLRSLTDSVQKIEDVGDLDKEVREKYLVAVADIAKESKQTLTAAKTVVAKLPDLQKQAHSALEKIHEDRENKPKIDDIDATVVQRIASLVNENLVSEAQYRTVFEKLAASEEEYKKLRVRIDQARETTDGKINEKPFRCDDACLNENETKTLTFGNDLSNLDTEFASLRKEVEVIEQSTVALFGGVGKSIEATASTVLAAIKTKLKWSNLRENVPRLKAHDGLIDRIAKVQGDVISSLTYFSTTVKNLKTKMAEAAEAKKRELLNEITGSSAWVSEILAPGIASLITRTDAVYKMFGPRKPNVRTFVGGATSLLETYQDPKTRGIDDDVQEKASVLFNKLLDENRVLSNFYPSDEKFRARLEKIVSREEEDVDLVYVYNESDPSKANDIPLRQPGAVNTIIDALQVLHDAEIDRSYWLKSDNHKLQLKDAIRDSIPMIEQNLRDSYSNLAAVLFQSNASLTNCYKRLFFSVFKLHAFVTSALYSYQTKSGNNPEIDILVGGAVDAAKKIVQIGDAARTCLTDLDPVSGEMRKAAQVIALEQSLEEVREFGDQLRKLGATFDEDGDPIVHTEWQMAYNSTPEAVHLMYHDADLLEVGEDLRGSLELPHRNVFAIINVNAALDKSMKKFEDANNNLRLLLDVEMEGL